MSRKSKVLDRKGEERTSRFTIGFRHKRYDLSSRTFLMGILNVTPDSFSDGGRFFKPEEAIKQGIRIAEEDADIIDIGGESTRPGSESVSLDEELHRVIPVIEELTKRIDIPISIDTYKSKVAKTALEAGAEMINDISALRFDTEMGKTISDFGAPAILMHIKGTPRDMQENPHYEDVVEEIKSYLQESIQKANKAGIKEDKIIVDPGIGFGKTVEDNLKILKNLNRFKSLGKPLLVGVSRKSFIGKILNLPLDERLEGSLAAMAMCIMNGANMIRVHDVRESKRVAGIVDAILKQG